MKIDDKWVYPEFIAQNWELVDCKFLEILFEQAKSRLEKTVESYDIITNRAFFLIGIFVTVSAGLLALLLNTDEATKDFKVTAEIFAVFIWDLGVLVICLIVNCVIIWPRKIENVGSDPRDLFELLRPDANGVTKKNEQKKALLFSEIVSYQGRINNNKRVNKWRSPLVEVSIFTALVVLLINGILALSFLTS